MQSLIIGGIAFVLMLSVLVFIHELGHFVCAKHYGVFCGEFSIGMGPVLFKKQVGETQYSIRLLPIGGFVSMAGEEDDTKKEADVPFERTLPGIKPYQQIVVMLAGVVMNFILAFVIFLGISMYQGYNIESGLPYISSVVEDSIAENAGFQADDYILSMTGIDDQVEREVSSFDDIVTNVNLYPQEFVYTVERDEELVYISAQAQMDEDTSTYILGITSQNVVTEIAWYESFGCALDDVADASTLIFQTLGTLLQGNNFENLSGPVGIYQMAGEALSTSWLTYLSLCAILSINLGILNALPLPVLDGGRVVIVLIEWITKRKVNEKILTAVMGISMFLLLGLMVYASLNDILRLF